MHEQSRIELPPDYHSHTYLCKHAEGEPADYIGHALAQGCSALACTDHNPTDIDFDPAHRMQLEEMSLYMDMLNQGKNRFGEKFLMGIEADYYPGCEAFLSGWLETYPFDIVLGSVHYYDQTAFPGPPADERGHTRQMWQQYFNRVEKLARTGLYDVVAHLDLPKKFGTCLDEQDIRDMALPALEAIAAQGMAIELNTSGLRHPVEEIYPSHTLLAAARQLDISITFGSDSHHPSQAGYGFGEALEWARAAGYEQAVFFSKRISSVYPLPTRQIRSRSSMA